MKTQSDDDFNIPTIPSSEDSLQVYIENWVSNHIDITARDHVLAKECLKTATQTQFTFLQARE